MSFLLGVSWTLAKGHLVDGDEKVAAENYATTMIGILMIRVFTIESCDNDTSDIDDSGVLL